MTQYLVQWEMDIEADSPEEAAQEALKVQRDPNSEATYFYVEERGARKTYHVDLLEQPPTATITEE